MIEFISLPVCGGGREPGRIGAGSVQEAGGETAGSGIPKVAATWRKGKFLQYCVKSYNINKTKRWEPIWKGAGSESKRYGRREIQTPLSPPHQFVQSIYNMYL